MNIAEKTAVVAKRIESFGVPVHAYQRGPNGPSPFIVRLNLHRTKLFVWAGEAALMVYGSKVHKQVVVNVHEAARTLREEVRFYSSYSPHGRLTKSIRGQAIRRFPVALPPTTTYEVSAVSRAPDGFWTATVTAHVEESSQSFLIGYDEQSLFISALPEVVTSVRAAHKVLRPEGVDGRAKRHGEFFFQPVSAELAAELTERLGRQGQRVFDAHDLAVVGTSEDDSEHETWTMTYKGGYYTTGPVVSWRPRRWRTRINPRHKPLLLNGWHRVYVNTEIVPENQDNTSWD